MAEYKVINHHDPATFTNEINEQCNAGFWRIISSNATFDSVKSTVVYYALAERLNYKDHDAKMLEKLEAISRR